MNEQTSPGVGPRPVRLQIGDQRIAACESAGSGRPIVLIHGNSSSARIWRKQMQGPLGGKYRLIAIDLPGHGESGRAPDPERDYSAPGYSACVAGIAKQLELEEAVFVGWSLGGHALLEAASALPMAKGLMIFGTPPIAKTPDGFAGFKGLSPAGFAPAPSDEEIAGWTKLAFAPGFAAVPPFFVSDFRNTDGAARGCLGAAVQQGRFDDEVEIVRARLSIPLAIVHGAEEQIVDLSYLQRLVAPTLWRRQVQVIAGAGHSTQWEQPQAFDEVLDAFAASV
ncbi:MAG: alpha/beta fold hydrolase [Bradyrhizobium sp.]